MPQADGGSRRSANWATRRDAIVDTSARVFAQNGYHATGINELCAANELGKGALYHYIGSKEELLAAIHDRVMDEVLASGARVAASSGTPSEKLVQLGDGLIDIITRFPDHVWVFLHEFPALTGERAETFRERRREYEKRVETVISAGVKAGEFRKVDPRLTTLAWLGMHNYTYLWWRGDRKLSPRDIAQRFADIFIDGIRA
ncbi:MAG TPA: TetR/AcrR family transcriptional regulator [Mycobacteriales bacterium]|nr:TetR/AcrR family transcriptional regulator [Mycobacteriales bacterium]